MRYQCTFMDPPPAGRRTAPRRTRRHGRVVEIRDEKKKAKKAGSLYDTWARAKGAPAVRRQQRCWATQRSARSVDGSLPRVRPPPRPPAPPRPSARGVVSAHTTLVSQCTALARRCESRTASRLRSHGRWRAETVPRACCPCAPGRPPTPCVQQPTDAVLCCG